MRGVNAEYIEEVIKILNQYNTGLDEDIKPCAEQIVKYFQDEIFYAICDARGD